MKVRKSKSCFVCWNDGYAEEERDKILRVFNVCKRHKIEMTKESKMDCSFCGSQSTTYKTGVSKSGKNAGKQWVAYDCNEPNCKNEKGYPNRTFAPAPRQSYGTAFKKSAPLQRASALPQANGELKEILKLVKEMHTIMCDNFGIEPKKDELDEVNNDLQAISEEEPF